MTPNPEDYLGLVQKFASFWARKYPYAADDVLSVAYVALLKQCKSWPGAGNINGWIKFGVDNAIRVYLFEDGTIRIPATIVQRRYKENPDTPTLPKVQGGDSTKYLVAEEDPTINPSIKLDQLDVTDLEKQIIKLRLQGKTLIEIAKAVGLKRHTNVIYYLKKIQEKYKWLKDNS